uniref:Uncharacterized protein n=1 Tax=Erythrolobus madagascarensis TaxID=708628 RepID=A0A7S0T4W2_9RHOD
MPPRPGRKQNQAAPAPRSVAELRELTTRRERSRLAASRNCGYTGVPERFLSFVFQIYSAEIDLKVNAVSSSQEQPCTNGVFPLRASNITKDMNGSMISGARAAARPYAGLH